MLTPDHLSTAYGPSLLHIGDGNIFLDDPAHIPVPGRDAYRQRVIHTDPLPTEVHHDGV